MEYVDSLWAFATNVFLFLLFGAKSYDLFAKSWLAHTGEHSTLGTINYSECTPQNARAMQFIDTESEGKPDPEGNYSTLLTYVYSVDNISYANTYFSNTLSKEKVTKRYYKGAQITVFYSPKQPSYSFMDRAPSQLDLIKSILFRWFIVPVVFLNLASCIFWYLFLSGR